MSLKSRHQTVDLYKNHCVVHPKKCLFHACAIYANFTNFLSFLSWVTHVILLQSNTLVQYFEKKKILKNTIVSPKN